MKNDVTLPVELVTGKRFSIEELGVIFYISCLPYLSQEAKERMNKNSTFNYHLDELFDKNVLVVKNGTIEVNVDEPLKPFWTLADHTDDDNEIYESPSPYAIEEGDVLMWRVEAFLRGMKVFWKNTSDLELHHGNAEQEFDSLEDAKEYFESENHSILESIETDKSLDEVENIIDGVLKKYPKLTPKQLENRVSLYLQKAYG